MVVFKMRDSVPSGSYSSVCNVLRQWNILLIPTYRVYRLYDICHNVYILQWSRNREGRGGHCPPSNNAKGGPATLPYNLAIYVTVYAQRDHMSKNIILGHPSNTLGPPQSTIASYSTVLNTTTYIYIKYHSMYIYHG